MESKPTVEFPDTDDEVFAVNAKIHLNNDVHQEVQEFIKNRPTKLPKMRTLFWLVKNEFYLAPPSDCVERHLLVDVITKVSCSSESQF